ncbi:hypothetical protein [Dinghuibacter silviterrae]|uniref:Outer membrane protein with beta-barrel domain n=1 Tax=Dinghuibacter silviterrae TaxID=1539049 RepID=A0A4R8DGD6_9BACT|nr:hypothetical protein [Dinghuibacter silviterrae]TDW96719.1 hypothetical protein EDB95_4555 [Dinghuibacter silviterrae]
MNKLIFTISLLLSTLCLFAQTDSTTKPEVPQYHLTKAYLSFIIPWVTINNKTTTTEFQSNTTIGFPVGINVYYSKHFGFSYEITPSVVWQKSDGKQGTSKTSNVLFDPGPIFRFGHGFNIITRLAFETQGRYGVTPVFNKVYLRTKDLDYWFSVSLPARFGNSLPASIGANLQIGFTFN